MRYFIVLLLSIFLIGCGSKPENSNEVAAATKRFPLKGKVTAVDKANKKATVEHEEVVGYMPPMTMDFEIRENWVWEDLKPGVRIQSELVVDNANGKYWLEKIAIEAASIPGQDPAVDPNVGQVGQPVPEFTLTDQDGKPVSLSDYKGKALAITFIYSRCPLPEFCIKMSTNFSDIARAAAKDEAIKDKVRLLSISFDPETDTPAKLRSYGLGYLGKDAKPDFSVWKLAVGKDAEVRKIADFFGLKYRIDETDKTQFQHNLRTIVVSPDGKVVRIFNGSTWKPQELLDELGPAAK